MLGSSGLKTAIASAKSIQASPIVLAEWNQNLFNPPYVSVAGDGAAMTLGAPSTTVTTAPISYQNFTTKALAVTGGSQTLSYTVTANSKKAYKIVTFVRTDAYAPIIVNANAKSSNGSYGSASVEINSFKWERLEFFIGGKNNISSFDISFFISSTDSDVTSFSFYFSEIKVFETTLFDYSFHSLYPTDSVFSHFRPGEALVETGYLSAPSVSRSITSYGAAIDVPCSTIISAPKTAMFKEKLNPLLKNKMVTDIDQYLYFVSDDTDKKISGIWAEYISTNKIVLKFQSLVSTPTVTVKVLNSLGVTDTVTGLQPNNNGILILYWHGETTRWNTTPWSNPPEFNDEGVFPQLITYITKVTVEQTAYSINEDFSALTFTNTDFARMQLIEISPRMVVNLTKFLKTYNINKSLDNKQTGLPISSMDSNDASFTFSGIPYLVPILGPRIYFSNESNKLNALFAKMLRKNVKMTIMLNIERVDATAFNEIVQQGVFYTDEWQESDIEDVSVQAFDVSRFLQSTPAPDYVAQLRPPFDVISDLLDLAGFSDYNYDELYSICHDKLAPLDLAYYFVNSKEKSIFDALNDLFLAYQIGAFIDEFGVMRFVSLSKILNKSTSDLSITDNDVVFGGYSSTSKAKPGKISVRYQPPKLAYTAAEENLNPTILNSPSFIYATKNEVVWTQQNTDAVGFNYLTSNMSASSHEFSFDPDDLLDVFHTASRNFSGYGVIEGEIVSYAYKEYTIAGSSVSETVSIRNDMELQARINEFAKKHKESAAYLTITPTGKITNVQRGMFGTDIKDHNRLTSGIVDKGLSEGSISNVSDEMIAGTANTSVSTKHRLKIQTQTSGAVAPPSTPSAPVSLKATVTDSSITVTWDAPLSDGGEPIIDYEVKLTGPSMYTTAWTSNGMTRSVTYTSLPTNTSFTVSVRALNIFGYGIEASISTGTSWSGAPSAPLNLAMTTSTASSATVTWDLPESDGGYPISSYEYYTSVGGGSGWITSPNGLTRSLTISGLASGQSYILRIRAVNSKGSGAYSETTISTLGAPSAPQNLVVTAQTDTTITISWSPPASIGGYAITGYKYSVTGTGIPGGVVWYTSPNGLTTNLTVTGLTSGGTYSLGVRATNSYGDGPATTISVTLASLAVPTEPTSLATTSITTDTWDVSWSAPTSDGGSAITDYQYSWSPGGVGWVSTSGALTASLASLTSGVYYTLQVRAVNGIGFGAIASISDTTL